MKIINVSVKKYKSIKESGGIHLHNKINVLAGKNNTGKSAFIEAIYKVINGDLVDHISFNPELIEIVIEINVSTEELNFINQNVQSDYSMPDFERLRLTINYDNIGNYTIIKKTELCYNNTFIILYQNNSISGRTEYLFTNLHGHDQAYTGSLPTFLNNTYFLLKNKLVYISGSRYVPMTEGSNLHSSLFIDGTNLNAFLYTLHNNEERIFDKIKRTFTQIFTDVTSISTPINDNNNTHISIYFEGIENPIPLSSCGSGYTHVLLLLCVLFTKKDSVVLFDEPQVFLHPSAEKAIYDLVNDIGEHQYLFTTHSPILINYPVEKHLFHVRKINGYSIFTHLEQMQEILFDIGVSNSDYALSDKIIFVEGETEELVIPIILSHYGLKQIGYNYRILNMKGTGKEFNKKTAMNSHREKLDLILGGVSQSPIPYKIIIDADNKTEEKIKELRDNYSGNIIILDRREYENYFLDCYRELAEIINLELEAERTNPEEIKYEIDSITSNTTDRKLFPRDSMEVYKDVVGSEVLERLFEKYSITYNKVKHGLHLTNLVLENTPEKLEFFRNELEGFIQS
ncbi:AAA family ATPase [Paenibacillus polymyxa]|uniref:ATP-dependent nuclease n=1 Tax=Paenibacillus polymyxa TaxID=1406 RepID=UPI002AB5B129|nr:AAA family ATPase [Paenibacillus polymyxa]MDY8046564.1 AAA family ATPase [Paenibacillus polymyxa]